MVNLTDSTGAITKSYTYNAFGVEKNIDDSDTNAFRYCGEYYDAETGTIYLRLDIMILQLVDLFQEIAMQEKMKIR